MTLFALLFYCIGALMVVSTALAVTRSHMVHAVLYLVLSFFGSAILFYLLGAPFLAALEVIIYAGAIMVLFLFVIMMVQVRKPPGMFFPKRQLVPALLIGIAFLSSWGVIMHVATIGRVTLLAGQILPKSFGQLIFVNHWLAVEIASLLLLVALIGAYMLGHQYSSTIRKRKRRDAMIVPLNHVMMLSAVLFALGLFCVLTRRNLIMMLLGIEIMLNASSVAFVGSALYWRQIEGQAVVLFVLAVAATEVSVGLAVIMGVYRRTHSMDPDSHTSASQATGPKESHLSPWP